MKGTEGGGWAHGLLGFPVAVREAPNKVTFAQRPKETMGIWPCKYVGKKRPRQSSEHLRKETPGRLGEKEQDCCNGASSYCSERQPRARVETCKPLGAFLLGRL